jgi:hypothetical protein
MAREFSLSNTRNIGIMAHIDDGIIYYHALFFNQRFIKRH